MQAEGGRKLSNMTIWDAVKQPPKTALKQIGGGRLKGMTDINPQWRYQVMTEQFGICGIGWKYIVKRVWSESTTDGQAFAFAEVELYIKAGDIWRDPIPGIGGSMLIVKEANGLHLNDEAYKMAITDALSVAMKMLGVGADIYAGFWDGTKYKDDDAEKTTDHEHTEKGVQPATQKVGADKKHWCAEHNTAFQEHIGKDGKSHWHSHKLPDGTWCNEDKGRKAEQPAAAIKDSPSVTTQKMADAFVKQSPAPQPSQEATGQQGKPEDDKEVDEIVQQIKECGWNKQGRIITWLTGEPLRIPMNALAGQTVKEIIGKLNHEQRKVLCKKLADLAELK